MSTHIRRISTRVACAGLALALGGTCMLGLAGCDLPGAGSEDGVLPASSSAADGVHASSSIAEVASSSAASSHAVDASVAADVRAAVEGIVAEYGEGV